MAFCAVICVFLLHINFDERIMNCQYGHFISLLHLSNFGEFDISDLFLFSINISLKITERYISLILINWRHVSTSKLECKCLYCTSYFLLLYFESGWIISFALNMEGRVSRSVTLSCFTTFLALQYKLSHCSPLRALHSSRMIWWLYLVTSLFYSNGVVLLFLMSQVGSRIYFSIISNQRVKHYFKPKAIRYSLVIKRSMMHISKFSFILFIDRYGSIVVISRNSRELVA